MVPRSRLFALFCGASTLAAVAGCAEDTCSDSGTCFEQVASEGGGGAGGSGGSGGSGGAPECDAGVVRPCYDGPLGTQGLGACVAGVEVCGKDGTFGPCEGAVTPVAEACDTPADDDCNGIANQAEAGCVCEPAAVSPCYEGPTGTVGVGVCIEGTKLCDATGMAYGACEGAVVPTPETCQNLTDDDCDGITCAAPRWATLFAGPGDDQAPALAANGTSLVLAGHTTDTLDFGGGPLQSSGGEDLVVTQLGVDGVHQWSARFGGPGMERVRAVFIDAIGNVLVAGEFGDQLDLQGTVLTASGNTNTFVAKLDPTGKLLWAKALGVSGNTRASGITVDAFGRVIVTGTFDGQLSCGGVPVQICFVSKGQEDAFAVAYDGGGAELWKRTFGDALVQTANAVVTDATGAVFLTGKTSGTMDVLGPSVTPPAGVTSLWVAKLDPDGNGLWVAAPGVFGSSEGRALALGAAGEVYVAGDVQGTVDMGPVGQIPSAGLGSALLGVFSAAGLPLDARLYGAPSTLTSAQGLTVAGGGLVLTGGTSGDMDFGGGVLPGPSTTGANAFLLVLDGALAHRWSRVFGGNGAALGRAVAPAPDGGLFLTAAVDGDVDVGLGPLVGIAGNDVLVARFAP